MTEKRKQPGSKAGLFHPVEHAILADYLGKARPACARDIDPYAKEELQPDNDQSGVVRLRIGQDGYGEEFMLRNSVTPG